MSRPWVSEAAATAADNLAAATEELTAATVRWCRLTVSKPQLKARLVSACDETLSNVALNFNLRRYTTAEELAAESAAVRGELMQAERRLQTEFTEGLAGEAGLRESADAAASIKLQQGLETESNARAAADDAMAAGAYTRPLLSST